MLGEDVEIGRLAWFNLKVEPVGVVFPKSWVRKVDNLFSSKVICLGMLASLSLSCLGEPVKD